MNKSQTCCLALACRHPIWTEARRGRQQFPGRRSIISSSCASASCSTSSTTGRWLNQELSADNAYRVAKEHFALNLKPQGRTRGSQHRLIVKGNITAAAISGPLTSVVLPIGEARLGLTDVICLGSGADAAILSRSGSNSGWDARSQYLLATKRTSRPSDKRFPVRTELDRLENGMEYSINPAKGRL